MSHFSPSLKQDSKRQRWRRKPPAGAAMKTCRHCRKRQPVTDFPRNAHTRDGLSSWCRSCHVEATRTWRTREHAAGRRTVGGRLVAT
jgi:hypothetical protein